MSSSRLLSKSAGTEVFVSDYSSLSSLRSSPSYLAMTMSDSSALILLSRRPISSLSVPRFLSIIRNGVSRGVEIWEFTYEFTCDVYAVIVMAL